MPKKKSGARKKAEKQKQRQKDIKAASESKSLVMSPCNTLMVRIIASILVKYSRVQPLSFLHVT